MYVYLTLYKYHVKKIFSELTQLIIQRAIGVLSKLSKEKPIPTQPITTAGQVVEIDENEDLKPGDFGFIISSDGSLKSLMIPENLMEEPPEEVQLILEMFGIEDVHRLENRTLH
jgi:hypothetical protein